MTTADMLRAEGRLEARQECLLELLVIKFGPLHLAVYGHVVQAPLDQVTAWMHRAVVASTLREVFEG